MELKQRFKGDTFLPGNLLIVPYGIETKKVWRPDKGWKLLIVPYGIETMLTSKR